MLNELTRFIRRYDLIAPGDEIICAVSGGADSVALLFGLYLLREKLGIRLSAAHFNHHLRGEESDRDERFVRDFCDRFEIPLYAGGGTVTPSGKGLEAAARDARYAFLRSLPGKIATAHTADDNAETVLLHLVRGTGLKGLGAIAPQSGNVIRPMLSCTRQQVEAFLEEYHISHITDSSNEGDAYLRNRLRHHVMPLLKQENPRLAENLSAMALRLREDEQVLSELAKQDADIPALRSMPRPQRKRVLERFLKENGVREPEAEHLALAEALVFSEKPSARADFPGGVAVGRQYDRLVVLEKQETLAKRQLPCPGKIILEDLGLTVSCEPAKTIENGPAVFTVEPNDDMYIRARMSGDAMRRSGGTKSLKKLLIDRKIPAFQRDQIPVLADEKGVLGVYGIGVNLDRAATQLPAVTIRVEKTER